MIKIKIMALQVWLPMNKDTKNYGIGNNPAPINYGATLSNNSPLGKCYSFSDTYISISNPDLSSFSNKISLALWVKLSSTHSGYAQVLLFGKHGTAWNDIRCGIDINNDGIVYFNVSNGSSSYHINSSSIKDNTWHHIVTTLNGFDMKLYVDGLLQSSGTSTYYPLLTNTSIYVGGNSGGERLSNGGQICDARIYDNCLTEEDVKNIYRQKTFDLSPLNNNFFEKSGLLIGDIVKYNVVPIGNMFYFNGTNASIKIPFLNLQQGVFSMNVWFYKNEWGPDNYETIFGGPSGFEIEAKNRSTNAAYIVPWSWDDGNHESSQFEYQFNQWNMLTITRTTSGSKFYLNGKLKYTGNAASIPDGEYFFGAWRTYTEQNYKGYMKILQIYSKELSADDIVKIYNEGINQIILPEEYQKIEYIESTQNEYINTGVYPSYKTRIDIVFQLFQLNANWSPIFSSYEDGKNFALWFHPSNQLCSAYATETFSSYTLPINTITRCYNKFNVWYKDEDVISTNNSSTFTTGTNKPIWLFGYTDGRRSLGRIYSCKFYEDNVIIRDMIPCKRKSDGKPGMYDTVNGIFYTNSGNGEFIAGPDMN